MDWRTCRSIASHFISLFAKKDDFKDRVIDESSYGIRFIVSALATWRVTHLLANEDGPADIVVRIRLRLGRSFAGSLMDCFNCLSFWIAAPVTLYVSRSPLAWIFNWLAVSGAACLLESLTRSPEIEKPILSPIEGAIACAAEKKEER
jgi:hypothetical protein